MFEAGRKIAGIVAAAALLIGSHANSVKAEKLVYGFAAKSINVVVANFALPIYLGYYKEEGLEVEIVALGANNAVAAALDQGRIDVAVGVPSFQLGLLAQGKPVNQVNYFEYAYPFKWAVAIKPGSPIKRLADLKGKRMGVSNVATSEFQMGKKLLEMSGVHPEKDVTWLAVGEGATAGYALYKNDIDALVSYDTAFGTVESAGMKLDYLPLPRDVPKVGGLYIATTRETLKAKRKQLLGFARAVAKAQIFTLENPEAAAWIFLQLYPDSAPRGKSMQEKVADVVVPIRKRMPLFKHYDPSVKEWGYISPEEARDDIAFLGLTGKIGSAATLYTNDLIREINAFDPEPIRKAARSFKIPY